VHVGDVIEKADGSVYGDGINIAARLQALAEADEVLASQAILDLIGSKPVADFEDVGEHQLKNVFPALLRCHPPGDEGRLSGFEYPLGDFSFGRRVREFGTVSRRHSTDRLPRPRRYRCPTSAANLTGIQGSAGLLRAEDKSRKADALNRGLEKLAILVQYAGASINECGRGTT
jgi:hypothetical protein